MTLKDAMLLGGRESRVEGKDLDRTWDRATAARLDVAALQLVLESLLGITDLALAREEHEDVAGSLGHEFLAGLDNAGDLVNCFGAAGGGGFVCRRRRL